MNSGKSRSAHSGWALLETVVATALLGWVVFIIISMSKTADRERNSSQPLTVLVQSHLALVGYAVSHHQFPEPEQYILSPDRIGYLEGWLPTRKLGLPAPRGRIRYLVDAELVKSPTIYNADPMNWTEGKVLLRNQVAPIDFCASLLRRDLGGKSLPNGLRVAYAIQQASDGQGAVPLSLPHIWLKDTAQVDLPSDARLHTLQRGFTEIAVQMRCFQQLDEVVSNTKMAAAIFDMSKLAGQEVLRRELAIKKNEYSIANLTWRLTSKSVDAISSNIRFSISLVKVIQSKSVPSGIVALDLGILSSRNDGVVGQMGDSLGDAVAAIPELESGLSMAKVNFNQLNQEMSFYFDAANRAQGVRGRE